MCIGTLLGYKVHNEDPTAAVTGGGKNVVPQAWRDLPVNAATLRNLIHGANHIMSHILHFYHLVALDYVNPGLTRPFLAPRYDDGHYINDLRWNVIKGLLPEGHVLKGEAVDAAYVNNYLVGQYLKALDIRRICHEMGAIFSGRNPICSGYTPGGVTATVDQAGIDDFRSKLTTVLNFIGTPADFANSTVGTMMFDVVAAAHVFLEYFWIGNSYGHFMAYGWGENGFVDGVSDFADHAAFGGLAPDNPDGRGFRRGYRLSAQAPYDGLGNYIPPSTVDILKIGESIANSRYNKIGGNYPDGAPFKHPWAGDTNPRPDNEYSWLKSPRYNTGSGYLPFEVGPLARMVVQGDYFAGVLNALGYGLTPTWNLAGPDLTGPHPLSAAYPGGGPNLSTTSYMGDSVIDRIGGRAVETLLIGLLCQQWLNDLEGTIGTGSSTNPYGPSGCTDPQPPNNTTTLRGYGMTEASRGALGHWIAMKNGKTTLYQAVVPTTWNASPRDVLGNPGPAEKSLENEDGNVGRGGVWVSDPNQPIELVRVTHSYDFCIACAVHLITPKGDVKKVIVPALP